MTPARISLISGLLLLFMLFTISLLWLGRHAALGGYRLSESQREWVLSLAALPSTIQTALQQAPAHLVNGVAPELVWSWSSTAQPHWVERFPAAEDTGYLLFSGVRADVGQSVIELIRLSDGRVLNRWVPNLEQIHALRSDRSDAPKGSARAIRWIHPVALQDGSIVVNTIGSLVKFPACSSSAEWVIDAHMHHSNEVDSDGNLVVNGSSYTGFKGNTHLQSVARDDAIMWVSPAGHIIKQQAFSDILIDNNLQTLLLGFSGFSMAQDPIHQNQITPALSDGAAWKKNDLLISARHLSTVFLYRPSTNKIIWHQTGPWLNQHAVAFVGNQKIVVFSNNVYGGDNKNHFLKASDHNRVFLYDLITHETSEPWQALLRDAKPRTITEGRVQVLDDGGLFIEETNQGRLLRFSRDKLMWSWVNRLNDTDIGAVSWSRYLSRHDAQPLLSALSQCDGKP